MKHHVHIFGASGTGTTTIAAALCRQLGYRHLDSDDYYWLPTENPFTAERPAPERLHLMETALEAAPQWILSGSLTGWGETLLPRFDLVVFVTVPQAARMERLEKREYQRYGDQALPGGSRYKATREFLAWAAEYESGARNGRSLPKHEAWLQTISCPVLRLVNEDLKQSIEAVSSIIKESI